MTSSVASATASIRSNRSSASAGSVRSQRSERSQLLSNGGGGDGNRAPSSDGLEKRAHDEDDNFSLLSSSSKNSKTSSTTAKKRGQIADENNHYPQPAPNKSSASSVASVSSQRSSTSKSSSVGHASKNSSSTVPVSNVTESSRLGRERFDEGKRHLEQRGDYVRSISLFTQAIEAYQKGMRGTIAQQQALATIYSHRCEALYAIGAYPASVRDARKALECEERNSSLLSATGGGGEGVGVGVHPYSKSSSSSSLSNREKMDVETGAPLRAKVLCSLGYSLLRGGDMKGVKAVFHESLNVAKKVLGDADDLTEGWETSSTSSPYILQQVVASMKDTMNKATVGLSLLEKYEMLKMKWETKSYMGDNIEVLDGILEIAPGSIDWHVSKVVYLIRCQRWFAVANHCEQVATRAIKYEGVFRGDLADMNPFPEGIPPIQDLNSRFFDEDSIMKGKGLPSHLRTLSPNAARDAAFRLPNELLPFYLRALRLDERYTSAVKVGMALLEFHDQSKSTRYAQEFETLDRTIKVKEEGDKMYRDSNYERALTLYGECLNIDGNNESGRRSSILRKPSHPPVAFARANSDGGKLHAVLHSNRAACFMAMGRYDDAIQESSHAIVIHSTYTKALLRRARCYVKIGELERARADYNRLLMLIEGARKFPYPPKYQGSTCFFDMPSDVTQQQQAAMKLEMNSFIMHPKNAETTREVRSSLPRPRRQGKMSIIWKVLGRPKKWLNNCMKNANTQVISSARGRHSGNGEMNQSTTSKNNDRSTRRSMKRVSFTSPRSYFQPQSQSFSPRDQPNYVDPTLANRRPPFEHPIEPPILIDTTVDYYAILGVPRTATGPDIKRAYHKLALQYHPDRNSSADAQAQFQEINRAYTIIGDSQGRKDEYDHKRMDP